MITCLGRRLHLFVEDGKLEEAKLLIADPICDVNWVTPYSGWTLLTVASYYDNIDIVKVLLERQDLWINHRCGNGNSALMLASLKENLESVKLLLGDPRTDVNLVTEGGDSALGFAYIYSCLPIMKLLISHGANIEGVAESILKHKDLGGDPPSAEANEVMVNWKLCLPEFTRVAKTNKYYPSEFKEWAFNFILCCLKSRSFPKDIIHLLLEYIARAWKRI